MEEYFPRKAWLDSKKQAEPAKTTSNWSLPAQELFGNRFYSDQTTIEILSEFLLIATSSEKKIVDSDDISGPLEYKSIFPEEKQLSQISSGAIEYNQESRINLKLFAILLNSGNPNPYPGHKILYDSITKNIKDVTHILDTQKVGSTEEVIAILSNLFMGFQGIGANRDWCAQSFIPVSQKILAGETIWKSTKAKHGNLTNFDAESIKPFFERSSRNFYSHGGELLYLQLLLVMKKNRESIDSWLNSNKEYSKLKISSDEKNPQYLMQTISDGLHSILNEKSPRMLGELATFIDNSGEQLNLKHSSRAGWIPEVSWQEGYFFALDLVRIFKTEFDVIEWLKMLEMACVMQVFRSFLRNSSRFIGTSFPLLATVSTECKSQRLKLISKHSLKHCQLLIHTAIEKKAKEIGMNSDKSLRNMHQKYGDKVFLKLAKSIQFVMPLKGNTEHFVMTKSMLTYLVVTTLLPNEKMSYQSFLEEIRIKHGLVFDEGGFNEVNRATNTRQEIGTGMIPPWLLKMLDECGFLIPLSDSLSLVVNSAGYSKEAYRWH
nr:hypothetical protein [uncultured Sphaerochaeta sp.]